ncbi:YqgE/AlgH family protein [Sphingomonas sp.]|uniref:YqgE/AlgH family protein n=1 Tax=Sphingomonas sp. TaxID=28214 RepID=UPI002DD66A92|nr:YqgE/AlgH family protein [Sphingomonas sp.]
MQTAIFLTGQFLLAMPGIGDPRFDRAVIAMCSHDENGALGIGLGSVLDGLSFHDVLKQLDIDPGMTPDVPVCLGGPCEPRRGFVLHSRDWSGADSVDVAGRWVLSGTLDVLKAIAAGTGPARWVPALGYAGWGEGQLDGEMTRHGWFNVAGDDALLFDRAADDRWEAGFAGAGINPRLLAATTGRA